MTVEVASTADRSLVLRVENLPHGVSAIEQQPAVEAHPILVTVADGNGVLAKGSILLTVERPS